MAETAQVAPRARSIAAVLGSVVGSAVVRTRRLGGGLAAVTHAVWTADGRRFVLKRDKKHEFHAAGGAGDEHDALLAFAGLGPIVPIPVALDGAGEWFGTPAVLMTMLGGRALLRPADLGSWCRQLAETMAAIHAMPAPSVIGAGLARPTRQLDALPAFSALREAVDRGGHLDDVPGITALVERIREVLASRTPAVPATILTHNDFHPGNLLWSRGRLTGVTDWAAARRGSPAGEVSYCRVDVALLHGETAADLVADAYRSITGDPLQDLALWDLRHATRGLAWYPQWLGSYGEQGLRDLSPVVARRNLLALAESAFRRLAG